MTDWRRLGSAGALLGFVIVVGTIGYLALGFSLLDANHQTVTTISTVGFREVQPLDAVGRVFTIALILFGVGATLYAISVLIETLIEGRLLDLLGRRRMTRTINDLDDHVIICGWGRVGRAIAEEIDTAGRPLVVIDIDPEPLESCPHPHVVGDATEDLVLSDAGLDRAGSLVAAVDTDAANSFITLSARASSPELFIVARARSASSESKLRRSGADRVVNPQHIGGARMAAFVLGPTVAEFLDVVVHDRRLEFRLEEITVTADSAVAGTTLAEARLRHRTGALAMAVRDGAGAFRSNPSSDTVLQPGEVLIAFGTEQELTALGDVVRGG